MNTDYILNTFKYICDVQGPIGAPSCPLLAGWSSSVSDIVLYHMMLCLQKEGVLGLVKGDWDEPTTRGKEYL